MAFFKVDTAEGWLVLSKDFSGGNSNSVNEICRTILGPVGTILAIVGVVICPITSGDTALRSCRLIVGESFKLDQKKIKNRLILTAPLFAIVMGISIWNFLDSNNFNTLWRWFAWSNQILAAISLWVATAYLTKTAKNRFLSLFTAIPALFMTTVVVTYFFTEQQLVFPQYIPYYVGIIVGACISLAIFVFYLVRTILKKDEHKGYQDEK